MNNQKALKYLETMKEIMIFIFLIICFMLPIFRQLKPTFDFAINNEYNFIKVAGIIGIFFLIGYLYFSYKKFENKKEFLKENLPILFLVLYMVWTLISSIFAENRINAFSGTDFRKDGYISYIAYAGFFSLALCLKSDKLKKVLLNTFIIIAITTIGFIEIARHGYLENIFWVKDVAKSVFYNINHHGYYLLIATTIANYLFITEDKKILKILYVLVYAILLYYLILNNTFGCYLALFATLIIFFIAAIIKKEKRILAVSSIAIFILISILSNFNISSENITTNNVKQLSEDINAITSSKNDEENNYLQAGSGRLQIWIYGLKFFVEKPILGYGPENLRAKYEAYGIDQDRPHNIVIQQLTTSGLPGCILYFTALGIILFRGLKNLEKKNGILVISLFTCIAYIISAMLGNSMYYTSPYFFIVLGLLMGEIVKDNERGKGFGKI